MKRYKEDINNTVPKLGIMFKYCSHKHMEHLQKTVYAIQTILKYFQELDIMQHILLHLHSTDTEINLKMNFKN